ncbi:hypothetical protein QF028_001532 [Neobacillus sp. B4I6]
MKLGLLDKFFEKKQKRIKPIFYLQLVLIIGYFSLFFLDINRSFGYIFLSLSFLLIGIESYLLKEKKVIFILNFIAFFMFALIFILDYFNL